MIKIQQLNFDAVIFDMDGTILNTLEDLADSMNHVLKEEGFPLRSLDEIRAFVGNGVRRLVERSLPEGKGMDAADRCLALFKEHYETNKDNKTRPYRGIPELMDQLKENGVKIGVVSNKYDEAVKELATAYFGDRIDSAVGIAPERLAKPSPDGVFEAMKDLGAVDGRTLFVGDSDVDIQTAKNAGLVSAGVLWGFRSREVLEREGADYIVSEPEELLAIAGINKNVGIDEKERIVE